MNTTTSTTRTTTYTVVDAMFSDGYEVSVKTVDAAGVTIVNNWLRTLKGVIRVFSTRNAARKAITRELRRLAGVPGALHN